MKRTEFRLTGLGSGETVANSERTAERMWWTQARQPSRKASSTAGVSVKRLKEDAVEPSGGPDDGSVTDMESAPVERKKTFFKIYLKDFSITINCSGLCV